MFRETGVPKTSVHHILRHEKRKKQILVHAMDKVNPDIPVEICEWVFTSDERKCFPDFIASSDKSLKFTGIGPRKIQGKKKNEQEIYQGCQCGVLCSRDLMGPHFFEATLQVATV
jgi:hypothetical protein